MKRIIVRADRAWSKIGINLVRNGLTFRVITPINSDNIKTKYGFMNFRLILPKKELC